MILFLLRKNLKIKEIGVNEIPNLTQKFNRIYFVV